MAHNNHGNSNAISISLKDIDDKKLSKWIEPKGDIEEFAKMHKINSTQLRKFYSELKNIETTTKGQKSSDELSSKNILKLKKLIAFLAYSKGRKIINNEYFKFLSKIINEVKTKEQFDALVDIYETLIAYAKYHKKDN